MFGLRWIHRGQFLDGQLGDEAQNGSAQDVFFGKDCAHVRAHASERARRRTVRRAKVRVDLVEHATRKRGRGAARFDGDREVAEARRREHREVSAIRCARIADRDTERARIVDDAGIDHVVPRGRNRKRRSVQVAGFVRTFAQCNRGIARQRTQFVERLGRDDDDAKTGGEHAAGFAMRGLTAAHDGDVTTLRAKRDR